MQQRTDHHALTRRGLEVHLPVVCHAPRCSALGISLLLLLLLCLTLAMPAAARAQNGESQLTGKQALELVRSAWDQVRGKSSVGELTMTIHRPDWERTMSMKAWTSGTDHSLVRITEPRKDAGSGTLMLDEQMWTYAPKINRVIKVPSSMMGQSWMGSDFSNKDVSRADDIVDSYDHELIGTELHDSKTVYIIESTPHEDAAVVWGKEILRIREDGVLLSEEFYDQDFELVKSLRTREIGELGGRTLATRQRMVKTDAPDEWTEIHFRELEFDVPLEDWVFTQSNLRNPRESR